MKKNDTEQRALPPTVKKLRDARRKGQIWHSRAMVTAAVTAAALAYLWLRAEELRDRFERLLILAEDAYRLPFRQTAGLILGAAWELALGIVGPLMVLVIAVSVASNIVVTRGIVFAAEPIKPKAERLNPAEGLKRMFSLRNWLELLKAVLKTAVLAAVLYAVIVIGLDTLVTAPSCGIVCIDAAFAELTKPVVVAALAVFLAAGLLDLGVQRWLFLREMRMTATEMKRERKDLEGDPLIRGVRRKYRREVVQGQANVGVRNATVIVSDGGALAVGLRYVRGDTPAPVLVCKGTKSRARAILDGARGQDLPIVADPDLAQTLAKRIAIGAFVTEDLFHAVARILRHAKAV